MSKAFKKIFFIFAMVGLVILGLRLHFINSEKAIKAEIIEFVHDNVEDLKVFTSRQKDQATLDQAFKSLTVQRNPDFPDILDFAYEGKGFGSANTRYGIYYVEKDDVRAGFKDRLKETSPGIWAYRQGHSDNTMTLEKIADEFYIYKMTD